MNVENLKKFVQNNSELSEVSMYNEFLRQTGNKAKNGKEACEILNIIHAIKKSQKKPLTRY